MVVEKTLKEKNLAQNNDPLNVVFPFLTNELLQFKSLDPANVVALIQKNVSKYMQN